MIGIVERVRLRGALTVPTAPAVHQGNFFKKMNDKKPTWETLFPTPILRSNIGRAFTHDEQRFLKQLQTASRPNVANSRTTNTYILDAPEMRSLRTIVQDHVNQFAWKVISSRPEHEFYITQSWVNFTRKGESHHRHYHTNSLISGSLYVQVDKQVDSICFYRNSFAQLLVSDSELNTFNAPSECLPVDVGDLILFPSSLVHDVRQTAGAHTRISLAFNAFIKGELGSEPSFNRLTIGST